MNTTTILNVVTSLAFEHAMDNVKHAYLDGYEVFPEKRFEIYMADPTGAIGGALFECKLNNRTGLGFLNGVPRAWDNFCLILEQFKLKKMSRGKEVMPLPLQSAEWWEIFDVVMEDAKALIPDAIYDEKTGLWWLGDKAFDPRTKKEV